MYSHLKSSLLILLLCQTIAWSHAHVFIDYKLHAIVNESGITGVYVNWTFDKMFTAFVKKEFDLNKDNKLSKTEQQEVYKHSFLKWKEDNYFMILRHNQDKIAVPSAEKFSARLTEQGNSVQYTFFLPLDLPTVVKTDLYLLFMDPSIYVDFTTTKESITQLNKSPENVTVSTQFQKVDFSSIANYTVQRKKMTALE